MDVVAHGTVPRAARPARPVFYVGLSFLMVALVVLGFWPSYFGKMVRGDFARPLVIQLHGIVFVGWMVLLVAQVSLAAAGRIRLHRTVGRWGIAYGYGVLAMGLVAGLAAPVMHFNAGEWSHDRAAAFLLTTIGDMVLFGSLFTAAVVYRNRPEIHKRLMLAATVALLFAAVGRLDYLVSSNAVLVAVWLSPLVIGAAYDLVTRRRVHPAYIISTAWLVVGATRLLFADSEAWLRIGRPLLDAIR